MPKPSWLKVIPRKLDAHLCRCGALVLQGWDEDLMALKVTVDRLPLSPLGEMVMLRNGRTTYTVENNRLYVRYWWRMLKYRHHEYEVLASHECGVPIDGQFGRTEIQPKARNHRKDIPDEPEF